MIGLDEVVESANFQVFKVSVAHYRLLGTPSLKLKVSPEVMSVAQEMITRQFQLGQGLGKNDHGISSPIQLPTQLGRTGLGYHGGSRRRNPHKRIPPQLSGILLPKVSGADSENLLKKVPPYLSDILMPKVGNDNPNSTLPDDEEEILIYFIGRKSQE